jgi:transketolase
MRDVFGEALLELCHENEKIVVLDGDLSNTTKTLAVREAFPERFFNIGLAESNMVSIGAGLARCGFTPFITSMSAFLLSNAYDQLRLNIAIAGVNAKVVGSHGGITLGKDGPTAMGIEDFALVGGMPTFTIVVPCDPASMWRAVFAIVDYPGPVYLRSSRLTVPEIYPQDDCPFEIGKANVVRQGGDLTIIACGLMVAASLDAATLLEKEGIEARVVDLHTLRPLDEETILNAARETGAIVSAEEHLLYGGMGSNIARVASANIPVPMRFVGLEDTYTDSGDPYDLLEKYGMMPDDIATAAREAVKAKDKVAL